MAPRAKARAASRGRTNKAKGKTGERVARALLESYGWFIADKETQGLAGDDLFAQDPEGNWWSVEVKNVASPLPKYLAQAKEQARVRAAAIAEQLKDPRSMASRLGITFDARNWLLMWKPSGWGNGSDWITFTNNGRTTKYDVLHGDPQ